MIAKHVPMRSLKKSDFAGLAQYITGTQGREHRIGAVTVTNCQSGSLAAAIEEIAATQLINTRAKGDKTYHLILSFRAGEQPDIETLREIENQVCAGLGYSDHQRVSAVHNDTDNLHMHIAINKIHPDRYTMHEPYQDYRTLAALCSAIEIEFGLERDNHQQTKHVSENLVADMERHSGIESLCSWIKSNCLPDLQAAKSWDALHQVLGENELTLREQGNGFVIEAADGTQVKASTVSRELSKPQLEKKLGSVADATDAANATLQQWVNHNLHTDMVFAESWRGMHRLLRDCGLSMRQRDGTLMIEVYGGAEKIDASNVHPGFVLDVLEKKLGKFEPISKASEGMAPAYGKKFKTARPTADGRQNSDFQTLGGRIKSTCLPDLLAVKSWDALHQVLGENELTLREQGNGFVIEAADGTQVKASTVSRELSKSQLEKKLGSVADATDAANAALQQWVNHNLHTDMVFAESWRGMHRLLRDCGLSMRLRDEKLMIEVYGGAEKIDASNVHPGFVLDVLEKKLGKFEPISKAIEGMAPVYGKKFKTARPTSSNLKTYAKRPIGSRVDSTPLYALYKTEQNQLSIRLSEELGSVRRRRDAAILRAKRNNKLRRSVIKISDGRGIDKRILYAQAHTSLKKNLEQIRDDFAAERSRVYAANQRLTWADWLKDHATKGDQTALALLRARKKTTPTPKDNLRKTSSEKLPTGLPITDNITKQGTIIYRAGQAAVRDDGNVVRVSSVITQGAAEAALHVAMQRYGNRITINGTAEFKAAIIKAAVHNKLPITFTDATVEKLRQKLLTEENLNGFSGRSDRSSNYRDGARIQPERDRRRSGHRLVAPGIAPIGGEPPPASKNRLRTLSQLGVVHIGERDQLLLPGDVRSNLDNQKPERTDRVRRTDDRAGRIVGGEYRQKSAAEKYIAERETKRLSGFDIPKHKLYNEVPGRVVYAGVRRVDEQSLLLFRDPQESNTLFVKPIDAGSVQRLTRVKIGDEISITPRGAISIKGKKI